MRRTCLAKYFHSLIILLIERLNFFQAPADGRQKNIYSGDFSVFVLIILAMKQTWA